MFFICSELSLGAKSISGSRFLISLGTHLFLYKLKCVFQCAGPVGEVRSTSHCPQKKQTLLNLNVPVCANEQIPCVPSLSKAFSSCSLKSERYAA